MNNLEVTPLSFPLKVGESFTATMPKRGWRKLWARITGKPVTELKHLVCTATSDQSVTQLGDREGK